MRIPTSGSALFWLLIRELLLQLMRSALFVALAR